MPITFTQSLHNTLRFSSHIYIQYDNDVFISNLLNVKELTRIKML